MRLALVLLLVAAAIGLAAQEHSDTHPPVGVTFREESQSSLYEATVPGPIVDWAAVRTRDGRRDLFLLAAPEGAEADRRALFLVALDHRRLTALRADLPSEVNRLAAVDLDGDGVDELLLGRPGWIASAAPLDGSEPPALTELLSAPGVDLAADLPVRGATPLAGHLSIPTVGLVRHLAPDSESTGWGLMASSRLATRASRHQYGLRLTTPPSALLRLESGDVYAAGPEAVGTRRLRNTLLPADNAEVTSREVWSRLPGPERVQWSWFHVLDGRPVLLVTTNSADKLGIFERQQLRLFSLYGDRTQAGVGPWLTATTTSRRWQRVEPFVTDLEGDGDDDLVIAQLDGLGGGKVKFEAFVNSGGRRFETRTRSTVLAHAPAGWHFGVDFTGDDIGDLVLYSDGSLMIFQTLAGGSRRLLAKEPRWTFSGDDIPRADHSVEIDSSGVTVTDGRASRIGRPTAIDLDGENAPELVLAENPRWGFGRLRVVFLPSP